MGVTVVYLENFDGRRLTLGSWRRTVETAGQFAGVDSDNGLVVAWPSEARELPGLGLSSAQDRSGDDVKARRTGRAGSMTFGSCLPRTGSSLQHKYRQHTTTVQCKTADYDLYLNFCSVF